MTQVPQKLSTALTTAMDSYPEKQQAMLNDYLDELIEQLFDDKEARVLLMTCAAMYDDRVIRRKAQNADIGDNAKATHAEYMRAMLHEVLGLLATAPV